MPLSKLLGQLLRSIPLSDHDILVLSVAYLNCDGQNVLLLVAVLLKLPNTRITNQLREALAKLGGLIHLLLMLLIMLLPTLTHAGASNSTHRMIVELGWLTMIGSALIVLCWCDG